MELSDHISLSLLMVSVIIFLFLDDLFSFMFSSNCVNYVKLNLFRMFIPEAIVIRMCFGNSNKILSARIMEVLMMLVLYVGNSLEMFSLMKQSYLFPLITTFILIHFIDCAVIE